MDFILVVIKFSQVYLSPLVADDAFNHNRVYRKRLLCHAVKYVIIVDAASKYGIKMIEGTLQRIFPLSHYRRSQCYYQGYVHIASIVIWSSQNASALHALS